MANFPPETVAVLFSGGDAPGMNACLRAIARLGINQYGTPVIGVRDGFLGLVRSTRAVAASPDGIASLRRQIVERVGRAGLIQVDQDLILLDHAAVSGIVGQGGILLGSARCSEFMEASVRADVATLLRALNVRSLIVCGGDGSLTGASTLAAESGLSVIGIPGTIDNDLPFSEMAIGVDTAVSTLVWAVEHFKDTARSHRRIMVLETMGRDSGELAVRAAISSGAEIVLTPEQGPLTERRIRQIAESLETSMSHGRTHAIVLVAEGVPLEPPQLRNRAWVLADAFRDFFHRSGAPFPELEVRPSVLGHLQRGGKASPLDALLAAQFAHCAWEAIARGDKPVGVTALRHGCVELIPFGAPAVAGRAEKAAEILRIHSALSQW